MSKSHKSQSVLIIYDSLLSGEGVCKEPFCNEYGVSERTFFRYISEIRCFLMDSHYDLELAYLSDKKVYVFRKVAV